MNRWSLLPLRLFLGGSLSFAGFHKLADPGFFSEGSVSYIGRQLDGFARTSPIGGVLRALIPHAELAGMGFALSEVVVGSFLIAGLLTRVAAGAATAMALTLWVTSTWSVSPFFLGSDLPYAALAATLCLAGAPDPIALDNVLRRRTVSSRVPTVADAPGGSGDSPRRDFVAALGATAGVAVTVVGAARLVESRRPAARAIRAAAAVTAPTRSASTGPAAAPATTAPATASPPTRTPASTATAIPTTTEPRTATPQPAPPTTNTASGPIALANAADIPVAGGSVILPNGEEIVLTPTGGSVVAFDSTCTHTGCSVAYDPTAARIYCPCHGSTFDAVTGEVLGGPARLPLTSIPVTVVDGIVYYEA